MLRQAVAACLLAGLLTSAAAAQTAGWRPHVTDAGRFARRRRGEVAFAICTQSGCRGEHVEKTFPSASLLKAMLLVAYLRRGAVRDRPIPPRARALLVPMIRRSDNDAATRVRDVVGSAGLRRLARAAGMRRFTPVAVPWGNSRVDAIDQARFFMRIDALVPRRHRAFALSQLAHVIGPQRWGVARVAPRGWRLYFKGGWGSGTGRVDHQSALLVRGGARVSLSILTEADGTHAYGKQTLQGVAARLLRGLDG